MTPERTSLSKAFYSNIVSELHLSRISQGRVLQVLLLLLTARKVFTDNDIENLLDRSLNAQPEAIAAKWLDIFKKAEDNFPGHLTGISDFAKKCLVEFADIDKFNQIFNKIRFWVGEPPLVGHLGKSFNEILRSLADDSELIPPEIYTPGEIAELISTLVYTKHAVKIYDPACGSGGFLLSALNQLEPGAACAIGHEINQEAAIFARMVHFLAGNEGTKIEKKDAFTNSPENLPDADICISNPPFSHHFRYNHFAFPEFRLGIPPKRNSDWGFFQLGLAATKKKLGKVAFVMSTGAMIRSGREEEIRRKLVCEGGLKAIIALPSKLFRHTNIAPVVVLFDHRHHAKDVLFVNASEFYLSGKVGNRQVRSLEVEKILQLVREDDDKGLYSRKVNSIEIEEKGFNLNPNLYVDTAAEKSKPSIEKLEAEIADLNAKIRAIRQSQKELLDRLQ